MRQSYIILFALILALSCYAAWDATNIMAAFDDNKGTTKTIVRECVVSNRHFTVHYTYNPAGPSFIPTTSPPGPPHYDCIVTVYENGKQVGKSFRNQVTENGCHEDVPTDMVGRALAMPIATAVTNELRMIIVATNLIGLTDDQCLTECGGWRCGRCSICYAETNYLKSMITNLAGQANERRKQLDAYRKETK